MWPILLKILSVIGIVIGAVLGVVILLLLLLLLCPITYKVNGSIHEGKYDINAKVHYLFGIVRAIAAFPDPGSLNVKIFWFTIFTTDKESDVESDKESDVESDKESDKENSDELKFSDLENDKTDDDSLRIDESAFADSENNISEDTPKADEKTDKGSSKKKASHKKDDGIHNPIYHVKKIAENLRHKFIVKIKNVIREIKFYTKLLQDAETLKLLSKFKKRILKIFKIIAPKKGRLNLTFGFETPDTTGIVYGLAAAVFARWPGRFVIIPDFEKKCVDGDADISGHFNLISLAFQALPVVLCKELKRTRGRIDAHMSKNEAIKRHEEKKHENKLNELKADYQ